MTVLHAWEAIQVLKMVVVEITLVALEIQQMGHLYRECYIVMELEIHVLLSTHTLSFSYICFSLFIYLRDPDGLDLGLGLGVKRLVLLKSTPFFLQTLFSSCINCSLLKGAPYPVIISQNYDKIISLD